MDNTTSLRLPGFDSVFLPGCVESFRPETSKTEVIHQLVCNLASNGRIHHGRSATIAEALVERERLGTTGMGKGLALPHMRSQYVDDFVGAVGFSPLGINFESLDGLPTRLVILLISPFDQRELHCSLMGRLASLLSDKTLQYSLQAERSPESLLAFLKFH